MYEYKVITIRRPMQHEKLTALGMNRWRLTAVDGDRFYFMRKITKPKKRKRNPLLDRY